MPLAKRVIPCLDVTAGRVVKGINFVTSSRLVRPPLAMTGTVRAWASLNVASTFTPLNIPSRPMSV